MAYPQVQQQNISGVGTAVGMPRFGQQQMTGLNQILQSGLSGLANPTQGFAPIAQQARSQFNQQTVPGLAERFTSMGGRGSAALSSPAFASQLGQAGAGLEENLAAMQAQYGMQNQGNLLQMLQLGLQPQYENMLQPEQQGFWESILPGLLGGIGQGVGTAGSMAAASKFLPFLL